jgi:hypothetical protein
MWSAAVVISAALLASAQDTDDGVAADDCDIVCLDDATLSFCDGGEAVTLACGDVDVAARCAWHSEDWGFDCVLPTGAACDPAYAYGRSRCESGLACRDGVCAPGAPAPLAPLEPTAGTTHSTTTTTTNPVSLLNCQSCGSASMLWMAPLGLGLGRVRRRRQAR